jgi:hypothetical protein
MSKNKTESLFLGILLLALGLMFFLNNFGFRIEFWSFFRRYWPMILIFIGAKNLVLYFRRGQNE